MEPRQKTDWIAVHCSATRPSMDIGVNDLRKWHKSQGWEDVGYHWIIRRNGALEEGRAEEMIGSHVKGYNAVSVGVCLVGGVEQEEWTQAENNFTEAQFATLRRILVELKTRYPEAKIQGHRDFPNVRKACPSFDVAAWLKEVGLA
jgi:N-acetylmuramoyl-L-alanine amidase